ncbi:hypothetical protein O181_058723 [Austropuccinia psidii MF-1]|uniref:Uncharacterized protein n=1 Tax=Austropuccinia psidii MF-1 TaxID=1389203 RepID=A0A9Q3HVU2_9BASI|nr:hypothetical protein [Austropuccinia psidii MF-1]
MSSKLTELTYSSTSVPPPSFLCDSGILSWMASSGHFDPGRIYDGYKAVEVLDPTCTEFWPREKIAFSTSTQNLQGATSVLLGRSYVVVLGQKLPTSEGTCGVKRMALLGRSPQFLRAQILILLHDILIVVNNPVGHQSSTSPSEPPFKRFQSCLIPSTPRNFQPTLAAIPTSLPHSSPNSSHTRPAINPAVRPSPIQQSRASPIVTSQ